MQAKIDMIGIITSNFEKMRDFYSQALGFEIALEMENYVEFKNDGVRFSISTNEVMKKVTNHGSYDQQREGQALELAFRSESPQQVNIDFGLLLDRGAASVAPPADMPWGQRAAFFADPDGNIHEIFADFPKKV